MANMKLTIRTSVAWWVQPYIKSVVLFAVLTGCTPDAAKVERMVMKGIKMRVVRA